MKGKYWPVLVVSFLVADAIAIGIVVAASASDSSHYVVEDYYQKAVRHDDAMERERESRALAWVASAVVDKGQLKVTLRDKSGAPIENARVSVIAYHLARASERQSLQLEPEAGVYSTPLRVARLGRWRFELSVRRGAEEYFEHLSLELSAP